MKKDFSKPCMNPGTKDIEELIPDMKDIPEDFRSHYPKDPKAVKFRRFQSDWFFFGLKNLKLFPKEGVDQHAALRHLSTVNTSFEPKHEHKEAAFAYLASLWFDDVNYERGKPEV